MKQILIASFFTIAAMSGWSASASTESIDSTDSTQWVYGSGRAYDFCDGSNYYFCANRITSAAEENGRRDAVQTCRFRGGTMYSYSAVCNTYCSPSYMAPDSPSAYVECTTNCNGPCETPN